MSYRFYVPPLIPLIAMCTLLPLLLAFIELLWIRICKSAHLTSLHGILIISAYQPASGWFLSGPQHASRPAAVTWCFPWVLSSRSPTQRFTQD